MSRFMDVAGALSQIIQNPTNTIDQDIILGKMRMRPLPWNSLSIRECLLCGVFDHLHEKLHQKIFFTHKTHSL